MRMALAFLAGVACAALAVAVLNALGAFDAASVAGPAATPTPDPLCIDAEEFATTSMGQSRDALARIDEALNEPERSQARVEGRKALVRWATVIDEFPDCFSASERVTARQVLSSDLEE